MKQIDPNQLKQLSITLQGNLKAVEQLKKHLKAEQEALRENNRDDLANITEAKNAAILKVSSEESKLVELFKLHGLAFSANAFNTLLSKLAPNHQSILKSQWHELQKALQEAKHLNQVNGKVIIRIANGLTNVVNFLNGQDSTQQVYQASGAPKRENGSRLIAQA